MKKRDLFLSITSILICIGWIGICVYAYFFAESCAYRLEAICRNEGGKEICAFSNQCPSPRREIILMNFQSVACIFLILFTATLALFSCFKKVSKKWILVFLLIFLMIIGSVHILMG